MSTAKLITKSVTAPATSPSGDIGALTTELTIPVADWLVTAVAMKRENIQVAENNVLLENLVIS